MQHVAEQRDEIEPWLAGLANTEPMQIGRAPERLRRAGLLADDAHDLVRAGGKKWNEA